MLVRTSPKESMRTSQQYKAETEEETLQFQDNFRLQSTHERYT
jgi:hypothetical protein